MCHLRQQSTKTQTSIEKVMVGGQGGEMTSSAALVERIYTKTGILAIVEQRLRCD